MQYRLWRDLSDPTYLGPRVADKIVIGLILMRQASSERFMMHVTPRAHHAQHFILPSTFCISFMLVCGCFCE